MMLRRENWPSWGIGLVFGGAAGLLILVGGAPFLILGLLSLGLAFVAARSIAFLSGSFVGMSGLWFALAVRAQLACQADRTCRGSEGAPQFLTLTAAIFAAGLLLGVLAWRRRADQLRSQAGS